MTVKLKCPVCGDYGTLMKKETITKIARRRYRYEKWYVYHNKAKGTKQRWSYLSKKYLELPEIIEGIQKEEATQNTTQITTQNTMQNKNCKITLKSQKAPRKQTEMLRCPGSIVRSSIGGCHALANKVLGAVSPPDSTWLVAI